MDTTKATWHVGVYDMAVNTEEWGRGQGTGTGGQSHEVALNPRTLQDQVKKAETEKPRPESLFWFPGKTQGRTK